MKIIHTILLLSALAIVGSLLLGLPGDIAKLPVVVLVVCIWLETINWSANSGSEKAPANGSQTHNPNQAQQSPVEMEAAQSSVASPVHNKP